MLFCESININILAKIEGMTAEQKLSRRDL
jgi:hypothetical protein